MCEKLSKNRVEIGIVPIGAVGLSLFTLDLYFSTNTNNLTQLMNVEIFITQKDNWRIIFDLIMIGACGGIFSVPFYATIQEQANIKYLSRIIAANNVLNALFMVSASLLAIISLTYGMSILEFFALISGLNVMLMLFMHNQSSMFSDRFLRLFKR